MESAESRLGHILTIDQFTALYRLSIPRNYKLGNKDKDSPIVVKNSKLWPNMSISMFCQNKQTLLTYFVQ